ncbi:uncharacterized protein LOC125488661 [Plutella xylostella]|uniref:uncharacterized protein LOC125488661 n=1 Tax=Plutella xylostella TaxID=51655 RepID=UPI002032258E|nr:uncharacterized protein LOC125488661 [Plutella xylostella]
MTFLITPVIPFTFPINQNAQKKQVGYEEVIYTTIKDMNLMNLSFIYKLKNDEPIGFLTENYTATGLMKLLQNGSINGIFGGIILSNQRIGIFDLVEPHFSESFVVVVPNSGYRAKWRALFPSMISNVCLLTSFWFIFFCYLSIKVDAFEMAGSKDVFVIIMTVFGYFVGTATRWEIKKIRNRLMVISWIFFSWLLSSFYQSNLSSEFTKPLHNRDIQSLQEAKKANYKFHIHLLNYNYAKSSKDNFIAEIMQNTKPVICETIPECLDSIGNDGFTMVTANNFHYFNPENHLADKMHVITPAISSFYAVAYVKKGYPDLEHLRTLVKRILSASLHEKQMSDISYDYFINNFYKTRKESKYFVSLKHMEDTY